MILTAQHVEIINVMTYEHRFSTHKNPEKRETKNIHKSNHLKIYVKQAICCNTCQWPRQPERMRSLPLLHSILSHSRFFFSPSRIYMTSVCYRKPFQSHSKCPTDENLFLDNVRAEWNALRLIQSSIIGCLGSFQLKMQTHTHRPSAIQ